MTAIEAVQSGDTVTVQDANGNLASGVVTINAEGQLAITAFGHTITIAKRARTGRLVLNKHLELLATVKP